MPCTSKDLTASPRCTPICSGLCRRSRIGPWSAHTRAEVFGVGRAPSAAADLVFQAGDTLGWSGNSGGSGGPHLHFEVRNTANQHPLNPLDGWLDQNRHPAAVLPVLWVETTEGKMRVTLGRCLGHACPPGKSRLAVEGYDLLDGAIQHLWFASLGGQVTSESEGILPSRCVLGAELDFGVNKDMNAHAFYPVWSTERDQVHRLHRLPTNRLGIYSTPPSEDAGGVDPGTRASGVARGGHRRSRQRNFDPRSFGGRIARES